MLDDIEIRKNTHLAEQIIKSRRIGQLHALILANYAQSEAKKGYVYRILFLPSDSASYVIKEIEIAGGYVAEFDELRAFDIVIEEVNVIVAVANKVT